MKYDYDPCALLKSHVDGLITDGIIYKIVDELFLQEVVEAYCLRREEEQEILERIKQKIVIPHREQTMLAFKTNNCKKALFSFQVLNRTFSKLSENYFTSSVSRVHNSFSAALYISCRNISSGIIKLSDGNYAVSIELYGLWDKLMMNPFEGLYESELELLNHLEQTIEQAMNYLETTYG